MIYKIVNQREVKRDKELDKELARLRRKFENGMPFDEYVIAFKVAIRESLIRMTAKSENKELV